MDLRGVDLPGVGRVSTYHALRGVELAQVTGPRSRSIKLYDPGGRSIKLYDPGGRSIKLYDPGG